MHFETETDLSLHQWEILRLLCRPAHIRRTINRQALAPLIELGLAEWHAELPVVTATGRRVLIRGAAKLLDLAA